MVRKCDLDRDTILHRLLILDLNLTQAAVEICKCWMCQMYYHCLFC